MADKQELQALFERVTREAAIRMLLLEARRYEAKALALAAGLPFSALDPLKTPDEMEDDRC